MNSIIERFDLPEKQPGTGSGKWLKCSGEASIGGNSISKEMNPPKAHKYRMSEEGMYSYFKKNN